MTRLKECRENARLSQKYVAITLGLSSPSVANWERGKTKPTQENIVKLADLYEVSVDYLLGRTDDPHGQASPIKEDSLITLSNDERILIERYRSLSNEDKELLRSDALRMKREAARGTGYSVEQTAGYNSSD